MRMNGIKLNLPAIAMACGYFSAASVDSPESLDQALAGTKNSQKLTFIEVKCALGARSDLGRPTTSPTESKTAYIAALEE